MTADEELAKRMHDRARMFHDLVPGSTYQVSVRLDRLDAGGRVQWNIAQLGPIDPEFERVARSADPEGRNLFGPDAWNTRAMLLTPPITGEQVKAVALAWLVAVEGVDPETVDCVFAIFPDGPFERINDPG